MCRQQQVTDLLDYVEGRYQIGERWQIHKLNRNIKLKIGIRYGIEETTVGRLSKYFDDIWCDNVIADLKTVNNIICNCWQYKFKNYKGVIPQKLVINMKLMANDTLILFEDADGEVHIPEIIIGEHGCFDAIVRNEWQNNKKGDEEESGNYSLV